jgi:hypothetical protein
VVVPKTEYSSSGVEGGHAPREKFEIKSLNAISSILGDDYTNFEDCKVHDTHDLIIYAGVLTVLILYTVYNFQNAYKQTSILLEWIS